MSNSCNNDCKNCTRNCVDRKALPDFLENPHSLSRINKVVGIVSGKGGVENPLLPPCCQYFLIEKDTMWQYLMPI